MLNIFRRDVYVVLMAAKLHDMQEGVETAFHNVHLDEKTAHEEVPDNVKDGEEYKEFVSQLAEDKNGRMRT